jgi:hypothetical protein
VWGGAVTSNILRRVVVGVVVALCLTVLGRVGLAQTDTRFPLTPEIEQECGWIEDYWSTTWTAKELNYYNMCVARYQYEAIKAASFEPWFLQALPFVGLFVVAGIGYWIGAG